MVMLLRVDDQRIGAIVREVRRRRGWRQQDLAAAAGISDTLVSDLERGHLDTLALRSIRRILAALDIRLELLARWRGGDLDRLLNAGHSAMHESLAKFFAGLVGWTAIPEVSFAVYGERGVIDILAWFPARRLLLVIELKTEIVDVQALIGTTDRYRRLAARIARDRGWDPVSTSLWVVVAESRTNRRHADNHQTLLHSAYPADGRAMRAWLRNPSGAISGLSFWTDSGPGGVSRSIRARKRIRPVRRPPVVLNRCATSG